MNKPTTSPSPSSGTGARTMVLLGVLAVLIAAVAYDFLYARPRAEQIHKTIFDYCDDSNANKPKDDSKPKYYLATPADIHKMLGEKFNGGKDYLPSKVTAVPGHLVETYSVMAGAVIRSHDVHVVYTANDPESAKAGRSEARFSTVQQGEFPKGDVVPVATAPSGPSPPPSAESSMSGPGRPGGGRPSGEAATTEPKKEEEKKEETKKEEPKTEEAKKEEPKADEPKKEEPKAEEPKKEEPKAEEPKKEEPKPEEPKAEPKPEEKPASEKPEAPKL